MEHCISNIGHTIYPKEATRMTSEYLARALVAEKYDRLRHYRCSNSHCILMERPTKE